MIAPALLASTAIVLLSLVSEDAATISSALSVLGGPLSWPLGFSACFAGIWVGDLVLYSLARYLGKPVLQSGWVARFANAAAIERCQKKFNERGPLALFVSRFVPGTRLPTYVAAGLLSMPFTRFALVTALAAFLWIGGIFAVARLLGSQALLRFSSFQGKIAAVVFTAFLIGAALFLFRKLNRAPVWVRRWAHWEFWPAWLFYIPVAVYYVWLAVRYRGFSVPTSANPGIPTGGFIGESKYEILQQLQRADADLTTGRVRPNGGLVADAYLIEGRTTTDRLLSLYRLCREHEIRLPFILKPDVGQRGTGVRLIRSMRATLEYLEKVSAPVIVQRYVVGPFEAGVFYYRFPGDKRGQIRNHGKGISYDHRRRNSYG
ncbi:MAG TPA: VTT domain-containing protein [Candidatus Udaeobacter sp.]|nr:VTT domain-containing protein [Candidatus Udaeobacter sp.]